MPAGAGLMLVRIQPCAPIIMGLVEITKQTHVTKQNHSVTKRTIVYECDHCGICNTCSYMKEYAAKEAFFCDRYCAAKSSYRRDKTRRTCLERYGVEHPFNEGPLRDKQRQTMVKLYGGTNVLNSPVLRQQVESVMVERYGASHPMHVQEIKDKLAMTNVERYGNVCPMQGVEIRKKIVDGWFKKFGGYPTGHPSVQIKFDHVERNRKRVVTLMKENRLWTSKPENMLYELLCSAFGDVKRQSWIARRSVDFFVSSLDLYIEIDGVYPHGLMKNSKASVVVLKKKSSDYALNEWFVSNDMKLFRMSDVQFYQVIKSKNEIDELLMCLESCNKGVTTFVGKLKYDMSDIQI